jgi:hypothetical protein
MSGIDCTTLLCCLLAATPGVVAIVQDVIRTRAWKRRMKDENERFREYIEAYRYVEWANHRRTETDSKGTP